MNEANYFIFCRSSSKKKIWCLHFFKVLQRKNKWNSKERKDTKRERERERERERQRESPKRYLSVKYIILKITYKKYV